MKKTGRYHNDYSPRYTDVYKRQAPCSSLVALAITCGTPSSSADIVVKILTSTFSPIQIIATSQFWIPISLNASIPRFSATNA